MFRLTRLIAVLPALLLAVPVLAPAADPPAEGAKVRAKLIQADYLEGKITESSLDGEEKSFTLTVTKQVSVLNTDNQTKLTNLSQQLQQAQAGLGKKPSAQQTQNVQKLTQQVKDLQNKLYDQVDVPYPFQCKNAKTFYMRRQKLPPKDGGAKYTPEEIMKLRGEVKGVDGYIAEAPDFEKDSIVRVWLDRNRLPSTNVKKDDPPPTYYARMIMLMPPKEDKKDAPKK